MSKYRKRAEELRNDPTTHYNCAQSVLIPFAEEAGISFDHACRIAANFGSGMKCGGTCGAITGGLMALGLFGVTDGSTIAAYWRAFKTSHDNLTNCSDLLRVNAEKGCPKKEHCDGMVYEAVSIVENILKSREA